ncbi:MAG: HD domain-containing protein [Patescibacteria group bacterium]
MKKFIAPAKYRKIWKKSLPLLRAGRPDDLGHAQETVNIITNYRGKLKMDQDILIPVAMMHDIGHAGLLEEHFKWVAGSEVLTNGKLVHMLVGAKIAKTILTSLHYPKEKIKEIVDIISLHDADTLTGINLNKAYNTHNKKLFHDIDHLDRFSAERIEKVKKRFKNKTAILKLLKKSLDSFFFNEFKKLAAEKFEQL